MIYDKKTLIWGYVLASIGGVLLHYVHHFIPNFFTALISPVNESLWEHVKIVIFPYIITASIITLGRPTALRPWLFSALVMLTFMLSFAYFYHIKLGGQQMWVDIALFFVVMAVGFYLPTKFSGPFTGKFWWTVMILMFFLILQIFVYSFYPPEGLLFTPLATRESFFAVPHPI